jgi:dolichol-phosphate mannosyltransferase
MQSENRLTLFSVIVPARDEAESLPVTLADIYRVFVDAGIPHEIVAVDDGSTDQTWTILQQLRQAIPTLRPTQNRRQNGFGNAVVWGLDHSSGDAVVVMMADASDSPTDAAAYWRLLNEGYDCAFGSRFITGGKVIDYPRVKLIMNRIVNFVIRVGFRIKLNDTTNAFKAYRRTTIDGCRPFLAPHFNLTVEIPLKAIVRGFSYGVIPISWKNRKHGVAKLKLKEMGSRYFFICAYVWLEKYFSRGDYIRK